MLVTIAILSLIGLLISSYGMRVEKNALKYEEYEAACDISDMVSCTKSFSSPYNKMLGISNIWASLLYYSLMLLLALFDLSTLVFLLSCAGLVMTAIFAYILYFKIRTLCLICTSLYVLNLILFVVAYMIIR